ncbi:hypothetical protein ACFW9F_02170 [Streptomyces sp. NPDC059506]|uniref:hypothetical protein n=1 Tax=unclassified Streptomyces TaxID=2593676 RepID=UPI000CC5F0A0|nr:MULTISPECIES: hypothetical protein [unclassified Streptomyces]MCZ2526005.1 hypothetical protein [Streptomyces sp. HB2AG]PLW72196.1 hypothetical protein C0036_13910 [Streptomyces sp. DJ]QMV22989.1 hypothetical protein GQS52_15760 [Streptomyces sp. SCUT-3]
MSRPSLSEVSAFLADLAAHRRRGIGDRTELMNRKADLLERIAADRPDDTEAAEVAADARARADALKSAD